MANKSLRVFFPITKIDEVQRTVSGQITAEVVDKANEILDYEGSAPHFKEWSATFEKTTGGKSLGNVRAMHKGVAAGKLTAILFDDVRKAIDCTARIVDDAEWEKCLEGVYTGFSMGGDYVRKWKDPDHEGVTRFIAKPSEVSIVDNPCVPTAHFSMVKADGVEVEGSFKLWEPSNDEVVAKATEMAAGEDAGGFIDAARAALVEAYAATAVKGDVPVAETPEPATPDLEAMVKAVHPNLTPDGLAAGVEAVKGAEDVDAAIKAWMPEPAHIAEPEPEIAQVWRVAADGSLHAKKAAAVAQAEALKTVVAAGGPLAEAIAAAKAKAAGGETPEPVAVEKMAPDPRLIDAAEALKAIVAANPDALMVKSLCGLSAFAELIDGLVTLQQDSAWEARAEGDDSTVPAALAESVKSLAGTFLQMANEEIAEALADLKGPADDGVSIIIVNADDAYAAAARAIEVVKADAGLMEKAGARNSKKDQAHVQSAHDHTMALGAKCDSGNCGKAEGVTVEKLTDENEALKAQIAEALPAIAEFGEGMAKLATITLDLEKAQAEIAALKKGPAPMPVIETGSAVAEKGGATGTIVEPVAVLKRLLDEVGPDELARLLIQQSQAHPMKPFVGR